MTLAKGVPGIGVTPLNGGLPVGPTNPLPTVLPGTGISQESMANTGATFTIDVSSLQFVSLNVTGTWTAAPTAAGPNIGGIEVFADFGTAMHGPLFVNDLVGQIFRTIRANGTYWIPCAGIETLHVARVAGGTGTAVVDWLGSRASPAASGLFPGNSWSLLGADMGVDPGTTTFGASFQGAIVPASGFNRLWISLSVSLPAATNASVGIQNIRPDGSAGTGAHNIVGMTGGATRNVEAWADDNCDTSRYIQFSVSAGLWADRYRLLPSPGVQLDLVRTAGAGTSTITIATMVLGR